MKIQNHKGLEHVYHNFNILLYKKRDEICVHIYCYVTDTTVHDINCITTLRDNGETDALQNTRKYPIVCSSINITFDTELWSELCASPG